MFLTGRGVVCLSLNIKLNKIILQNQIGFKSHVNNCQYFVIIFLISKFIVNRPKSSIEGKNATEETIVVEEDVNLSVVCSTSSGGLQRVRRRTECEETSENDDANVLLVRSEIWQ